MNADDFLESISESEYVYFDSNTGLFFNWNGLQIINVWSTDDGYDLIDTFSIEYGKDSDFVMERIEEYLTKLDVE